ncbi:MAG TPA: hypothetical protein VK169_03495 [Saprospiraceae bacterium]|nr:hypothetical protein [Saprospiraceae bacterium]
MSKISNWSYRIGIFIGLTFFVISCKDTKSTESATLPQTTDTTSVVNDNPAVDISFFQKEGDYIVLPWKYLMNVTFEDMYKEDLGMEVQLPVFNDTLKVLDGKDVVVEGFYIPVDETGDDKIVILSAFPFAQCFFCGKAGVESIIDILSPKKLPTLKLDAKIKFKGRLKLNRDNFDYLIYVLEEAELVQ